LLSARVIGGQTALIDLRLIEFELEPTAI